MVEERKEEGITREEIYRRCGKAGSSRMTDSCECMSSAFLHLQ